MGGSIRREVRVSSSRGLGFALEEAAWDLAGGVGLLDVVNGGEIGPGRVLGAHHGGQNGGAFDVNSTAPVAPDGRFRPFHHDGVLCPIGRSW